MTQECFWIKFLLVSCCFLTIDAWLLTSSLRKTTLSSSSTRTFAFDSDAKDTSIVGVTLKIAVDAQGAAADLNSTIQERFTCDASLDMVHRLRASCQAVLVGKGTVQADNPSLLVRRNVTVAQQPLRVVLDPSLSLLTPSSPAYQLFHDGHDTVVFHFHTADRQITPHVSNAVQFRRVPRTHDGNLSLVNVLHILSDEFKVRHLMVEGGPYTAKEFLKQQLVDRCIRVQAPIVFTGQPLDAGMTEEVLHETGGLVYLGSAFLGVDTVTYWSRPRVPWPSPHLENWP